VISVVTWLWHTPGFRSDYTAARVNNLYRMVRKHYPKPFRAVCITDIPEGLDADLDVVPLWPDYRNLEAPRKDKSHPGCYHRLKAFASEMKDILGERFVSIDLDCVIVGDLRPVFDREADFVIWAPRKEPEKQFPKQSWNGSLWMMDAGARSKVWTDFTGKGSAQRAVTAGYYAADQGWMQYVLRHYPEAQWTEADGVYQFRELRRQNRADALPENARIVFFAGKPDPWDAEAREQAPWIDEYLPA
jgi:hypothetical protein